MMVNWNWPGNAAVAGAAGLQALHKPSMNGWRSTTEAEPNAGGTSTTAKPPVKVGPNEGVLWKQEVPWSPSSPVITGNRVLLNRDQDLISSLLAVDLETGKTVWETPRPVVIGGFGTPIYWNNDGVEEVVMAGSVRVKGYDLVSGMEGWMVEGVSGFVCTTLVLGDGMLYMASWSPGKADSSFPLDWPSFQQRLDKNADGMVTAEDSDPVTWDFLRGIDTDRDGSISAADLERIRAFSAKAENVLLAIRPGGRGDITPTHVAWKFGKGLPYVPSPLYYDGRVYLVKDGGMMSSFLASTLGGTEVRRHQTPQGNGTSANTRVADSVGPQVRGGELDLGLRSHCRSAGEPWPLSEPTDCREHPETERTRARSRTRPQNDLEGLHSLAPLGAGALHGTDGP